MVPLLCVGELAVLGVGDDALVGPLARVAAAVAERPPDAPRLVVVSAAAARSVLARPGTRVQRLWDVAEAHRIVHGGWTATASLAWAVASGLDPDGVPSGAGGDLFDFVASAGSGDEATGPADDPESPVQADGHLRAGAFEPTWASTPERLRAAARVLLELGRRQAELVASLGPRATSTVHSESAAALICLELERDGLPVDRPTALTLIARSAGPRPRDEAEAARIRASRDGEVLRHAPGRESVDLRNPLQVRELLAAVGVSVPNTRAHVLQPFAATHPLVAALLQWRKDERIATTYGYRWLDDHVGVDDRLRGAWSACDGAAGRMTAQHGLHNLPAPLRPAVAARPGHVFVRADLGQVEPRVLAVVSGDDAFAEASVADDLYAPVSAKLGVERSVAKIAVLAAMYGQRSGAAGEALKDLERAYPVAMGLLDDAYAAGVARAPLRTFGGRLLPLDRLLGGAASSDPGLEPGPEPGPPGSGPLTQAQGRAIDASRGRFARNAVIQGAAAELFKAWAATVRHAVAPLGAEIVLCLHDELLIHVPHEHAEQVVILVDESLTAAARRWAGSDRVRFVSDTAVVRRWSEAKA